MIDGAIYGLRFGEYGPPSALHGIWIGCARRKAQAKAELLSRPEIAVVGRETWFDELIRHRREHAAPIVWVDDFIEFPAHLFKDSEESK